MDGVVQPRKTTTAPTSFSPQQPALSTLHSPVNLAAIKTPVHYLRAMRQRFWLILVVTLPLVITTSILALRAPRIYAARAEITIEPPELNPALQTLIAHEIGHHDPVSQDKYIPNRIALLTSKGLADTVVADPRIASDLVAFDDPAQELIINALQVRPIGKTNFLLVLLEGRDPARTKKLLELLLEEFKKQSEDENWMRMDDTKSQASTRLMEMKKDLEGIDEKIGTTLRTVRTIGPGGRNIFEDQYINLGNMLTQKQMRIGELHQTMMLAKSFPNAEVGSNTTSRDDRITALLAQQKKYTRLLAYARRAENSRQFNHDLFVQRCAQELNDILNDLDDLQSIKTKMAESPVEMILDRLQKEIDNDKAQHQAVLSQMQDSMPEHQKFLSMLEDRKQTRVKIADMQQRIDNFEILKKSQKEPINIPTSVIEPTVPVRPNRVLYISLGFIFSLGLGIGLVVLLEHVDHSVKVPEHATHGLTLPLLGVVPQIRRTAKTHRGGHLWTPALPDSLEADSFRNIRASLLGVADRQGPIRTLLITSPKAGDGKSTTALNLAATCARAGERTLLVDTDLRRPTLGGAFPPEPAKEETKYGLVEVLKGILPWQKTLRHTELRNLDFIATGDPSDIPIEVLGTLELRQLLAALSSHYDRVILDGPAVLGMADCRMLGRMVDSSLLVMRAGVHQLVTLQRAKAMLELSHVHISGIVVNNVREDFQNWSSYEYHETLSVRSIKPPHINSLDHAEVYQRQKEESLVSS